jgi:putative transposase
MTALACPNDAGCRFSPESISYAVWPRFSLGLRTVRELLSARGTAVSYETVRQRALKVGQGGVANPTRRRLPIAGGKRHMGKAVLTIAGVRHGLRRAVNQHGMVLDIPVQSRRGAQAAKRPLCKRQCRATRVLPVLRRS